LTHEQNKTIEGSITWSLAVNCCLIRFFFRFESFCSFVVKLRKVRQERTGEKNQNGEKDERFEFTEGSEGGLMFLFPSLFLMISNIQANTEILDYIESSWDWLERSSKHVHDPKMEDKDKPVLYFSAKENIDEHLSDRYESRTLPDDPNQIERHGLLYLPRPYITPGGRFNEMYGWDSYFIQLGLIESGRIEQSKNLVENQLYQVEHYGHVLNSNRTYHLTRSHPPFLTQMVLNVYRKDTEKLKEAYPLLVKYHAFWTSSPRYMPQEGLTRYYDHGQGAAPEVLSSEVDEEGVNHYQKLWGFAIEGKLPVASIEEVHLEDRAMRESGFDISFCFGQFGMETTKHLPVCLNTLLYVMERDLAKIAKKIGLDAESKEWKTKAKARKHQINTLLWNPELEIYSSWNIATKSHSDFAFITTFYPLWAKIATKEQAAAVVSRLPLFEAHGGLMNTPHSTGCQWDAPYGWAPMHFFAVKGLLNYGYIAEAVRIMQNFLSLIEKEFSTYRFIFEKYNVREELSETLKGIRFGYGTNEVGFGWTNGVYLVLLEELRRLNTHEHD